MHAPLISLVLALASATDAPPPSVENLPVAWRYLQWKARSGILRAGAEAWLEPEAGGAPPGEPGDAHAALLRARWDSAFTAATESRTWLETANGRVLQWETLRKETWKVRRVGADGLHEAVARPASAAERRLAPQQWSLRTEATLPPPPPGAVPADSLAILYVACAAVATGVAEGDTVVKLDTAGRSLERIAWSHGEPVRVEIVAGEAVDVPVGNLRLESLGPSPPAGIMRAQRLSLRAKPLVPGSGGAFDLFGMREGIEIVVAHETGLPLLVTGRAPKVGLVRVTLVRAAGEGVAVVTGGDRPSTAQGVP